MSAMAFSPVARKASPDARTTMTVSRAFIDDLAAYKVAEWGEDAGPSVANEKALRFLIDQRMNEIRRKPTGETR